ncbi:response regulator transcription factor [Microbacterium excoecariae]|uniref:response regulator transcription factor n=1 Tax=Microbacterium excoecariae TaxID=2715210 RepID=UPI001407BEB3|nr:response regulator transcription factor [Microbacterium excoecariae]NHI17597.1 response regulator [Microbacterium excoecariae]
MSSTEHALKTAVIVEDDPDIRHLLESVLESAGFSTVSVGNGIDGVRAVTTYQPLITTLDVNLPGIDGFEAARRIRAASDTYIIMLTALDEEADVVLGLSSGADEYLNKPFRPRELRARIEAMLRRPRRATPQAPPRQEASGPSFPAPRTASADPPAHTDPPAPAREASPEPVASAPVAEVVLVAEPAPAALPATGLGPHTMVHRDLLVDPESRIARIGSADLDLTRTEFDLLATLMESKRRVRSKADLTLVLRGESYVTNYLVGDADKRAIEAHMTNLRRKLGDSPAAPRYVETVRGVGYRLTSDATQAA